MLSKVARLFIIKTRLEAFAIIYALAVGAVTRGYQYLGEYPGPFGYLMFAACTGAVFMAGAKLQFFPEWMRPLAQYLVSDIGKIHRDIQNAKDMIRPILEQRVRDQDSTACEGPPNDVLQWFMEGMAEGEKADLAAHVELQLVIAAASIHTTNGVVCECMYDLAADVALQEELREEARQVLEEGDGWRHKESMAMLKKLDSFMREVHRLHGNIGKHSLGLVSFDDLGAQTKQVGSFLRPQG